MEDILIDVQEKSKDDRRVMTLVLYDITDNRKRARFCKYVKSFLTRVQKSCFEGFLTKSKFNQMTSRIDSFLDEKTDSVRVYRFIGNSTVINFGLDITTERDDLIIF